MELPLRTQTLGDILVSEQSPDWHFILCCRNPHLFFACQQNTLPTHLLILPHQDPIAHCEENINHSPGLQQDSIPVFFLFCSINISWVHMTESLILSHHSHFSSPPVFVMPLLNTWQWPCLWANFSHSLYTNTYSSNCWRGCAWEAEHNTLGWFNLFLKTINSPCVRWQV